MMKSYDLENLYDEQINPLMAKIIGICKEHKLPMFATFQFRASGDDEAWSETPITYDFCTSCVAPAEIPISDELKLAMQAVTRSSFFAFTVIKGKTK